VGQRYPEYSITGGLVTLFAVVLMMVYFIVERVALKKNISEKIQTFSVDRLYAMDSVEYQLQEPKPILLVFFNSECDHCQYELAEIKKHSNAFENTSVLLMSSENISTIQQAAKSFALNDLGNIEFLKINREDVFEKFGSLSVPHIFIYGADRRLIKEFNGETKIEAILQHLPK
jgi:thioredoxin-related protein